MAKDDPISVRLAPSTKKRLKNMIAATGLEITRSNLIERAVLEYIALVERHPCILEGYDPKQDLSVTQNKKTKDKNLSCNTKSKDV